MVPLKKFPLVQPALPILRVVGFDGIEQDESTPAIRPLAEITELFDCNADAFVESAGAVIAEKRFNGDTFGFNSH